MILMIDNYDSFAHNLSRYFQQLNQQVTVVRNDQITLSEIKQIEVQAIVLSPGPCTPDQAGVCLPIIDQLFDSVPILGVCLGHQAICQSIGGNVQPIKPMHGRSSQVYHSGHDLFREIDSPFIAGRYHSLDVDPESISAELEVIAHTIEGVVMAVAHRQYPLVGVQFHPESILTECGYRLLANFLKLAEIEVEDIVVDRLSDQLSTQTGPSTASTR